MYEKFRGKIDEEMSAVRVSGALRDRIAEAVHKGKSVRRPVRNAWALVLIGALLAGAAAWGAAEYTGSIDWRGKRMAEEEIAPTPVPEETPDPQEQARTALMERVDRMMEQQRPPEECWIAQFESGVSSMTGPQGVLTDFAQLEAIWEAADSPLWMKPAVPEGYAFSQAWIEYYLEPQMAEDIWPYAREETEGALIYKYRIPEGGERCIARCTLRYFGPDGERLDISGELMNASLAEQMEFGTWEGETHHTVSVPGMKHALLRETEQFTTLYVLKAGIDPIPCAEYAQLMHHEPDSEDAGALYSEDYGAIVYRITSETLSQDALIALAGTLQ